MRKAAARREEITRWTKAVEAAPRGGTEVAMAGLLGSLHVDHCEVTAADLTSQIVSKPSRKSPGGKDAADLCSLQGGSYWDDAKGGWLDPKLVKAARSEEMVHTQASGVYSCTQGHLLG